MQKFQFYQSNCLKRVRWKNLLLVTGLIFSFLLNLFTPVPSVQAAQCDDVEFIFARGSGEADEGWSFSVWKRELEQVMQDRTLQYSFYDLGAKSYNGHQYPAVPVTESFSGVINLIGAAVSSGEGFAFGKSVDEGVAELRLHMEDISKHCENTKFVLGGFSQGAMVLSKSLDQLDSDKIIYVATFGDPKIYLPEGNNRNGIFYKVPDACRGINLSNYRVYVPDCYAYEGALGSYRPYQPDGYFDKLGTWCNGKDIMCSSGMNISDHTDYVNGDLYAQAARVISERIRATYASKFPTTEIPKLNLHDIVFLFDATGSMEPLINNYKTEAKKLIQKVLTSGGRAAIYFYREWDQPTWPRLGCGFGCSTDEIMEKIDRVHAWSGGDPEEGLLSAINVAFERTDWRPGATKSIVALTDGGFHDPDDDGSTLTSILQRSLEIDPVNVYVIGPESLRETYAELTTRTNGAFFDIDTEMAYSTDRIYERPAAFLSRDSYYGLVGDTLEFDASASYGFAHDPIQYDWDLDGDGDFELTNQPAKISHTYDTPFEGFVQVRVHDGSGSSTMSAKVLILAESTAPAQIQSVAIKALTPQSTSINFQTDASQVLIVLGDAPIGFITPEQGKGNFSLTDLESPVELTLIPYSAQSQRGIKTQLTVSPDSNTPSQDQFPNEPTPSKPITPSKPSIPSPQPSHKPSISPALPIPNTPEVIIPPEPGSIPLAPNAGAYGDAAI